MAFFGFVYDWNRGPMFVGPEIEYGSSGEVRGGSRVPRGSPSTSPSVEEKRVQSIEERRQRATPRYESGVKPTEKWEGVGNALARDVLV